MVRLTIILDGTLNFNRDSDDFYPLILEKRSPTMHSRINLAISNTYSDDLNLILHCLVLYKI